MQTFLELLYYAAAAWYVAYAFTSTHGPAGMFDSLRDFKRGRWHGRTLQPDFYGEGMPRLHGDGVNRDGLFDCIICLSIWAALILRLIGANIITDAFAIAGIALWFHSFTGWYHHGKG